MSVDPRKHQRFSDFAKVTASDISVFSGILCDISEVGCLVRFLPDAQADCENDYEMQITPARKQGLQVLKLIVKPVRIVEETGSYIVAFKIMRSPGTSQLIEYLKLLNISESDPYENMVLEACLRA